MGKYFNMNELEVGTELKIKKTGNDSDQKSKSEVIKIIEKNSIYYETIGKTQKNYLSLEKEFDMNLSDLMKLSCFWFKN